MTKINSLDLSFGGSTSSQLGPSGVTLCGRTFHVPLTKLKGSMAAVKQLTNLQRLQSRQSTTSTAPATSFTGRGHSLRPRPWPHSEAVVSGRARPPTSPKAGHRAAAATGTAPRSVQARWGSRCPVPLQSLHPILHLRRTVARQGSPLGRLFAVSESVEVGLVSIRWRGKHQLE